MRRLAVILSVLLSWASAAQNARFVNYGSGDGLPSNTVYAIAQQADGSLLVGTRGGLSRFDGLRFQTVLPGVRVTSLAVDEEDRIWVGTTEGLDILDHTSGQNGPIGKALQNRHVRALCTDRQGFVWAATRDSLLVRFRFRDGKLDEQVQLRYHIGDFEGDYPVQQLFPDPLGRLWLGGRLVFAQMIEETSHPVPPTAYEGHNTGNYAWLGGRLWAYDDYLSSLLLFDEKTRTFSNLGRLPIGHAALLADSRGQLWAAGTNGLALVDTEKPGNSTVYWRDVDDASSIASTELYCIFEDRQGNLWTGGDNGLSVLCPSLQLVKTVSTGQVSALMEDRKGKLWIGTKEERISCLYEDRSGAVYVGFWNNTGFDIYRNGKKTHGKISGPIPVEQHVVADGNRVTSNWISDFLEGRDGRFYVVTWEGVGLNEWDRESGKTLPAEWLSPYKYPKKDKDSTIFLSSRLGSRLIEDASGNLVYGTTEAGINIIDKDTRLVTKYFRGNSDIPDDYVTDLCLAPDGTLWAATRSGIWSPSGKSFLQGKLVQSLEADARGRLWAGTEEGLFFVDTDGSIGRVPRELGLICDICGEHVSCTLADGSLSFGGSSGAVVFHPDSLLSIDARGNLPLRPLIRHRHRLNGEEWIEGPFKGFPGNTRPGRYLLEEQSADIFGRWEQGETTTRSLRVPPPLWLRWPFLLLYILLMVAIAWTFMRMRERRLLMKELDMRNRFFSIVSHDLRSPVSGNRLLTHQLLAQAEKLSPQQLKEGLAALAQSADNTSTLLENLLLWSLSQKGMLEPVIREESLFTLAKEAAASIQKGEFICIDVPEDLLVRTDRNMLLTCLRNLLDNAVKVTPKGGKVVLRARGNCITVTDEGPGLKEEAEWGHGLGLVITRELLDKMKAHMSTRNLPQGGLEITINLC